MLICSFPPLPPNGFVNLFVFGGTERNQQLGKEPPRAPATREAAPVTISGGRCPRKPSRFFSGIFGGAVLGPCWSILGPICAELDHN